MSSSKKYSVTTQKEVRDLFWEAYPQASSVRVKGKTQNDYPTDTRVAFVDYVEHLRSSELISEALAWRVTL